MRRRAGVLFQNRGTGFRVEPGHPNAIAPRKRPFHTIIPGMLSEAGRTRMAFGVMGGHYQAVGHAHFISQMLDRGFDPQMASDAPRSLFLDGTLWLEPTISEETRRTLERMGHAAAWRDEPLGGCQAIWIDDARGVLSGAPITGRTASPWDTDNGHTQRQHGPTHDLGATSGPSSAERRGSRLCAQRSELRSAGGRDSLHRGGVGLRQVALRPDPDGTSAAGHSCRARRSPV